MSEQQENQEKEKNLTGKQKKFAFAYLGEAGFCAAKAARLAGYNASSNVAFAVIGHELKNKPHVKKFIDDQMAEIGMTDKEVLATLARIARSSINDVIGVNGSFDLEQARENGSIHLVKKLKVKRIIKQKKTEVTDNMLTFLAQDEVDEIQSEVEILHEEIEFEMHDKHAAARDLGKHHKLFTDNINHSGEIEFATFQIETEQQSDDEP